jgi:hypothetical protein
MSGERTRPRVLAMAPSPSRTLCAYADSRFRRLVTMGIEFLGAMPQAGMRQRLCR